VASLRGAAGGELGELFGGALLLLLLLLLLLGLLYSSLLLITIGGGRGLLGLGGERRGRLLLFSSLLLITIGFILLGLGGERRRGGGRLRLLFSSLLLITIRSGMFPLGNRKVDRLWFAIEQSSVVAMGVSVFSLFCTMKALQFMHTTSVV
jgi:hypothetical protein